MIRENSDMKYLGIDFGLKRIGLACSEGELAQPLKVLEIKNFKEGLEKVVKIVQDDSFEKVIVGLPEGKMGKAVLRFIKGLKAKGLDIETADETLSSRLALDQMVKIGLPKEKRKVKDAYAAAIILQNYLDEKIVKI